MATGDAFLERFRPWLKDFFETLANSPVDARTWGEICATGDDKFQAEALRLLFHFAGGCDREIAAFRRRNKRLADQAEATIRALRVGHTRSPKKSTDRRLFERRTEEHLWHLFGSQLPFGNAPLHEDLFLMSRELGITVVELLLALPKAIRKMSGPRGLVTRLILLYFLRQIARERGVRLGVKQLAGLAG